jgi:o-succinylbenzoate---CoA ligase
MTVVDPGALLGPLRDALAGGPCVAPVSSGDAATLAMLAPEIEIEDADAALVVATSGSTGRPKGVLLSRAALVAAASATHARLGGPGVWHCALPTTYVAGVMTLVRAIVAGTEPVFLAPDLRDLHGTPDAAQRHYLSLVPTQLHRALASPALTARLAGFDAVLLGGAAIDPALRAGAAATGITVVTTYGMSETCGGCVYDGVPLNGVDVGVEGGEGGRVTVAGPVLFSGYRLDPVATASALVGGRFRTSDRGEWDADGRLRILGRLDDVVISGGVNVDLAAAQRAADEVFGPPETGGIVLVGVPDADWGTRIVAATASELTTEVVRARLGERLGRAALPRQVRRVDSLPRTAGGKIDRQVIIQGWR